MVCDREPKTCASVEDQQTSYRKYFPTVMVNVSQCLPINNYLTAAYMQLDKEMDIDMTNIQSKTVLQDMI